MSKINEVTGKVVPLPLDEVNTDRIIPARFMKTVTFIGLGEHVFADDREQKSGEHPFDLPKYQGSSILLSGVNFGCGSSREHAPQALMDWGIKAIIAQSFAGIFAGNCRANGIPCVTAKDWVYDTLLTRSTQDLPIEVKIDIEKMLIYILTTHSDEPAAFPCSMPSADRDMLIKGEWDSLSTLLESDQQIDQTIAKIPYLA